MKKTSLHDGHRDRLREKFIRHGLSSLEPHEVVELMLYAAVPRKDMNPLAHELLEGFGSFPALLDAPIEELMKYKGIGRGSAITIKLFSAIGRFYIESKADKGPTSMEEVIDIILSKFTGRSNEAVVLTLLDGKGNRVVGIAFRISRKLQQLLPGNHLNTVFRSRLHLRHLKGSLCERACFIHNNSAKFA